MISFVDLRAFINFLLVFMIIFTTKRKKKKKKKRPIKFLFERKKHNLKSLTSHHLVPFRNIRSAERICKEQNQLFRLCSETGVSAMTVCLLHRGLRTYLQTERKENARQRQRCKNSRCMFTACLLVHSQEYLSRLDETCTALPLVEEPGDAGFSWCDSVGGFSGSTLPPFQLGMQFGFRRHCQQPRLCSALIRF